MTKRLLPMIIAIVIVLIVYSAHAQNYPAPMVPVQGQIIANATGVPAPGLTIYLIHPVLGRSAPSFSDGYGRFGWMAIPVRPEPYYIEVYWGPNLVYRQPIYVAGPLMIPPIYL